MAPSASPHSGPYAAFSWPRRRADDDAAASLLQATVDALDDHHLYLGLLRRDGSYEEVFAGPNLHRLLGGTPPIGADAVALWRSRIDPCDGQAYRLCQTRLLDDRPCRVDYRLHGLDGVTRWVRARIRPQKLTDEGVLVAGILADVTEERQGEAELRATVEDLVQTNARLEAARVHALQLAHTDTLTGAANRRYASDVLRRLLAGEGRPIGVLAMDIDDFKQVNDAHGHRVGDEVLVEIVSRLHQTVRPEDTVARWGGEEFLILCPAADTDERLLVVAERIGTAIATRPVTTSAGDIAITVSIGGVTNRRAVEDVDLLLDAADNALRAAKRGGKNRGVLGRVEQTKRSDGP